MLGNRLHLPEEGKCRRLLFSCGQKKSSLDKQAEDFEYHELIQKGKLSARKFKKSFPKNIFLFQKYSVTLPP